MNPTIERFRALARSSPWRWSILRYVQERAPSGRDQNRVRISIRRPKLARVEQLGGTLLRVHRGEPQTVTPLSRRGSAAPQALPTPSDIEVDSTTTGWCASVPAGGSSTPTP